MIIKQFELNDVLSSGWEILPFELNKRVNLIVGLSGSGKSCFLNALMNIGAAVAQGSNAPSGIWTIVFSHADKEYLWKYKNTETTGNMITESLGVRDDPSTGYDLIFERVDDIFYFEDIKLPKIGKGQLGIYTLREEQSVSGAYEAFKKLMRRTFSENELGFARSLQTIPKEVEDQLARKQKLTFDDIHLHNFPLSTKLYIIKKYFPKDFDNIQNEFKSIFPNVQSIDTSTATISSHSGMEMPIAIFTETKVRKPIPIPEMSSGMLKVLLIISDIIVLPDDCAYLIDEYENSLGVNAINFLPDFLIEHAKNKQILLTSHHPYLINQIPVKNWCVFNRSGSEIKVTSGSSLELKYSKSKQQRFLQLMNDPIYKEQ